MVQYVRSLVSRNDEQRELHRQFRRTIAVTKVDGDLPRGPNDENWAEITATYLPVMPLWWRRERIEGVFVRAAHDGNEISLQLSWVDDTENRSVIRTEDFHDGAAIQFSAAENPPLFAMGATGAPVNIWHWKADWEVEQSLDQTYPNMASDHYPNRTDDGHVAFSSGQSVNVGFAVWNGAQMDRNGQKSVTIWHRLELEK